MTKTLGFVFKYVLFMIMNEACHVLVQFYYFTCNFVF